MSVKLCSGDHQKTWKNIFMSVGVLRDRMANWLQLFFFTLPTNYNTVTMKWSTSVQATSAWDKLSCDILLDIALNLPWNQKHVVLSAQLWSKMNLKFIMTRWAEPQRHTVVVACVCLCVCMSFARISLQQLKTKRWKLQCKCIATISSITIL